MIDYQIRNSVAILSFNMEGYPMNVINQASIEALDKCLNQALQDEAVKGIIITSSRPEFVAGGDLKMIYDLHDHAKVVALTMELHTILRKMETGGKPVVAAINGTCLGGGYEVTLAAHYRICINHPKVEIGLPEVTLGLLPGGGGTQRLPRMIGFQAALLPLLEGRRYNPEQAAKLGMVDKLVNSKEELEAEAMNWIQQVGRFTQPWDEKSFHLPGGEVNGPEGMFAFSSGAGVVREKTMGNYPAPLAILNCVYEGCQQTFDRALQIEAGYFADVVVSPEAKNMIRTLFFNMNKAKGGVARPKGVEVPVVKKVGILGAGMMGAGIAYVSALSGIETVLKDVSLEGAEKGKDYSRNILQKKIERGSSTQAKADAILDRIHPTADPADMAGCDLVVEAVFEDRGLKARVTQESEAVMPDHAVFASNTSTLPITGLAEASKRPERFIGLHFFSPVDKMQLVEVIMGKQSDDYALAMCIDYIKQIRKVPIVVNDSRGFFTSRIFKTFVIEGMEMLAEGIKPALIENASKMAGMPVGALAVTDEVSLSLMDHIQTQTEKDGIAVEENARKVTQIMVHEQGRVGKKAGKGFYEYPEGGQKHLWKGLSEHFPVAASQPSAAEVSKRLLHIQALESVRCLEEGVLRSVEDADIGSILGWGFPPYTGGVLSYIDFVGVDWFVDECDDFADRFGERYRPTDKLREMAANGQGFYGPVKSKEKVV
ncbi:MAG: enoyl-CoA hydratase/isomerase family protein [Bacteroidia bacterium]|nr:enoyl-CoA hydratase/isomerase family protein [Bacteroidia bacterium]